MSGVPNSFTLLWSKILDSSVWALDDAYRLVWITLLALKGSDGVVRASVPGLANRARVSLEDCQAALEIFKSPDDFSQSPEHEGRRLKEVKGGWLILNHEEYRFGTEARREFWREQKRKQRAKRKSFPLPNERAAMAAADERHYNALAEEVRPAAVPHSTPAVPSYDCAACQDTGQVNGEPCGECNR